MKKSKREIAIKNHIRRIDKSLDLLQAESERTSRRRLIVFLAGSGLGIAAYYLINEWLGWSLLALTLLAFNVIAFFHRRLAASVEKREIWRSIKAAQLARMRLDWENIPESLHHEPQAQHAFAVDLDVTGQYSLHRLLDIAISTDGGDLLEDWLLTINPEAKTIQRRQRLVKALAPLARFRDKLLMNFALASKNHLEGKRLLDSLRQQDTKSFDRLLIISILLAGLNVMLFTLSQLALIPAFWILSLTLYGVIYFMSQNQLESLLDDAVVIADELKKFRVVSKYLENYRYGSNEPLRKHCQIFLDAKNKPSIQLKRMTAIGTAIGIRMNPLLRLFLNVVVPWDFFVAGRLEKLKEKLAANLQVWLSVLFELEAALSLANFSYLNPDHAFPEILANGEATPAFEAQQLGHPLIPDPQKKTNDFSLKKTGDIALITGSNMSGKSTFLKTVGVNLSLAFAGGPVDAKSLKTNLFRLFTCIKINDSVTDGFSFFYAEVKRLKALLNELDNDKLFPVLFLVDEIFKGTNNRERLIGSRSYIKTLVGKRGLGIITTHDLELTQLADKIPSVVNSHFREDVVNGKMVFDYKMRPGPCPSTNALKIMQIEGLPVEEIHSTSLDQHNRAS